MVLISLLSLVLSIYSIFVGGGKGIALWVVGEVVLLVMAHNAHPGFMVNGQATPIFLAIGIQVVAIMISRWWGLLFHLTASVALTVALFLGTLATMTLG